jgi:RPA family protein
VQVTTTVPVPSSGVVLLALTGSYAPNARAVVEMLHVADTVALTAKFAVCVAAVA